MCGTHRNFSHSLGLRVQSTLPIIWNPFAPEPLLLVWLLRRPGGQWPILALHLLDFLHHGLRIFYV